MGIHIVAPGPENVCEAVSCGAETLALECQCSTAHFLVIAAPRPSGLPDLEFIQAGRAEGRFFLSGQREAYQGLGAPSFVRSLHKGWETADAYLDRKHSDRKRSSVVSLKFVDEQPQIFRLRLAKKPAKLRSR
jgi:hypothetical protein